VTRIQKERFPDITQYEEVKNFFVVDEELLKKAKEKMIVMHPLPRVNELDYRVDKDPRAAYFRQVQNGLYIRMALLAAVLGQA
jgi:aspartate carbamoyltransferase catalytic subunit